MIFKTVNIFVLIFAVAANYDDFNLEDILEGDDYNLDENFLSELASFNFELKENLEASENPNQNECDRCGISNSINDNIDLGRVINGRPVTPIYKYPWIVALLKNGPWINCGGALISASYVLTAAHCVFRNKRVNEPECNGTAVHTTCYINTNELEIGLLGRNKHDISKKLKVMKIVGHPSFSYNFRSHDIALVQLAKPVTCSDMTRPVCLPTKDLGRPGQTLIMAGWGRDTAEGTRGRKKLREGALREVPQKECDTENGGANIVCAVGTETKQAPCKGDSGSSIFGYIEQKYYAVGIVSYSKRPKCDVNLPVVYSKIFHYLPWIKSEVTDLPKPSIL